MPDFQSTLITLTHPRSAAAEAYRALRANLTLASLERPIHTLTVAAVATGEDTSVLLANLGVVTAQAGQRMILIDADLRHPSLHERFGAPNERGLTTVLEGQDALSAPPLVAVENVDGLHLLTSGPQPLDAAAHIGSRRMEEVIAALQKRAELVLLSAPPVLDATDAALLGLKTDGVLLIVQAKHTGCAQVQRAKELLEKARVRIVGVALTHATADR